MLMSHFTPGHGKSWKSSIFTGVVFLGATASSAIADKWDEYAPDHHLFSPGTNWVKFNTFVTKRAINSWLTVRIKPVRVKGVAVKAGDSNQFQDVEVTIDLVHFVYSRYFLLQFLHQKITYK